MEDIIVATLQAFELFEKAYRKRINRHKAYFSLNRNDGIERDITLIIMSPPEIYERKITNKELYTALNNLSEKQTRRIYAHFFLGMSKYAIAKAEGVDESAIRRSINAGLKRMKQYLKKI